MDKRSPAARWRKKVGEAGTMLVVLPLNLPLKRGLLPIRARARWVQIRMRRADFGTIAECKPELAAAINALPGLRCWMAPANFGGSGNAIVVNTRRVDDPEFSSYSFTYTAIGGMFVRLHMARCRAKKDGLVVVVDGVHAASRPSRSHYKTEAPDSVRHDTFRTIARNVPKDYDIWIVSGDTNWLVRLVLNALGPGWKFLGGAGVDQVFGRGAVKRGGLVGLGQRIIGYGAASDHHVTAKVRAGFLKKLLKRAKRA